MKLLPVSMCIHFPDELKLGVFTPIYKKGPKDDV